MTRKNEQIPSLETSAAEFFHPNNMRFGAARILWAQACTLRNGMALPEGWVLPGGRRTRDAAVAMAAAEYIDRVSR